MEIRGSTLAMYLLSKLFPIAVYTMVFSSSSNRSAIVSGARDGLYQGRPDPSQPEAEDQQGSGFSDIRAVPEITAADKEVHRPATN